MLDAAPKRAPRESEYEQANSLAYCHVTPRVFLGPHGGAQRWPGIVGPRAKPRQGANSVQRSFPATAAATIVIQQSDGAHRANNRSFYWFCPPTIWSKERAQRC